MPLKVIISESVINELNNKSFLTEKTLYHGTIITNLPSIEKYGLLPTIGSFVADMYGGAVDGDIMDYLEEVLYAADKTILQASQNAIIHYISKHLNKNFHDVTDEDFERYGALAVIKNGEDYFKFHSEKDHEYGRAPIGVETGDYYTKDVVSPDYILTGKKMTKFFRRFGLFPIKKY
jgi:hypothetical protein